MSSGYLTALDLLSEMSKTSRCFMISELANKLPSPTELNEVDERVIHVLATTDPRAISSWLDKYLHREKADEDFTQITADVMMQAGYRREHINNVVRHICTYKTPSRITSAGKWILSLSEIELRYVILNEWSLCFNCMLADFLVWS